MAKIKNEMVEELYRLFKNFYLQNQKNFNNFSQTDIVNKIIKNIGNIDEWNETSLRGYIINLIYMIKGKGFKWTINNYAENYFIENLCKDLGNEICFNAKKALEEHKIYYSNVTNKNDFKNIDTNIFHKKQNKYPLNQILYGPPGTGKTYSVIKKAVEIIDGKVSNDRDELKKRFDELKEAGQIEFITFHQSYSYEEFVEGLKPDVESEEIKYKIEEGIFKKICKNAIKSDNFDEVYNKLLEEIGDEDKILYTKTGKPFKIRVNSKDNLTLLTSSEFIETGTITKENLKLNNFKWWQSYSNPIREYLKELGLSEENNSNKNYILIIDEINRGNISKIFGELITLIEESKRIGNEEEMRVTLPYSKESFGVPKNLYIIGTMNTADRSIALMDTALRRRFEFVEMMPDSNILSDNTKGINLQKLLQTINKRIEYLYDRDHTIGHSYFMNIKGLEELKELFLNKIIPLLQEYFYDELEKIDLVLNKNGFIKEEKIDNNLFKDYEIDEDKKIYKLDETAFNLENFKKIYE